MRPHNEQECTVVRILETRIHAEPAGGNERQGRKKLLEIHELKYKLDSCLLEEFEKIETERDELLNNFLSMYPGIDPEKLRVSREVKSGLRRPFL